MQTEKLFEEIIEQDESDRLEFKITLHLDVITKVVCSFLNTNGGQILIGVDNSKEVKGIVDASKKIEELNKYLSENIVPEAPISVSLENIQNKEIILIKIMAGSNKPYVYNGTIFSRRGSQTTHASPNEVIALIESRKQNDLRWEKQPILGLELKDLDAKIISETIKEINSKGRTQPVNNDLTEFLTRFGFIQNGNLTNACALLFAKDPTRYISQSRCRLIVLEGSKTDSKINNDILFEKNLFSNSKDIMKFFETNFGVFSEFPRDDWQRKDYRFPTQALREGVLNALMHRDYSNPSGNLLISIFSDRLEIMNNGLLPSHLKPSDLKKNHLSHPRNPDIAHIIFLRGWIDKLGRGTIKIIEECKNAGLQEPKWLSKSNSTTLIYYKFSLKEKFVDIEELNERQREIIKITQAGKKLSVSEYSKIINMKLTDRSVRNDLKILVLGGWFKMLGKGKNTFYVRTEK